MNTPDSITSLEPHQVFVFGSNIEGRHDGGAARVALEKFGAMYGKGVGIQGQSYALPTMNGAGELAMYIPEFIDYVEHHPDKEFLLTKVGCGIAGLDEPTVSGLFRLFNLPNLIKPVGW